MCFEIYFEINSLLRMKHEVGWEVSESTDEDDGMYDDELSSNHSSTGLPPNQSVLSSNHHCSVASNYSPNNQSSKMVFSVDNAITSSEELAAIQV